METPTFEPSLKGKFSTELAITSFAIGTVLLVIQKLAPYNFAILFIGFFYVLFAILVNGIMLISLAYHFIILPKYRDYIAIKILILLANIPITILYILIVFNINLLNL
ncbi:hypothetical protein SAMN05443549_10543 [Flavobacterium fluvii]|uniref:Uncharacterized protein n=1 Tax=Flavobacterium fluvii TaxID=468056 RepID=A0A1M5L3P7_9FLAO|nr:hypothetical protein [Flavobacterium fluvii]SHG59043.1 hypothetical protein SAMN05443549_10543 [Flavobacterium fluvii]